MWRWRGLPPAIIAAVAVPLALAFGFQTPAGPPAQQDVRAIRRHLAQEVKHELLLLPYYSLFDNLEFEIQGLDTVVLSGQVVRPSLKNEAESLIRRLEGVRKVVDKIEVLPFSAEDQRLRTAEYHAIYSKPGLEKYALRALQPIHIILKNGEVTLVGSVADEADRDLAGVTAGEVPGIQSVTNKLTVEVR